MDLLTNAYDEDSNTPKLDGNKEDSSARSPHSQYELGEHSSSTAAPKDTFEFDDSSDSDVSSDEDVTKSETAQNRSSGTSSGSTGSSPSGSERSNHSDKKPAIEKEQASSSRGRRRTSSGSKMNSRRSRSRSASTERRRRRRSSERKRRSRSRDRHHRSSHTEKKSSRRSRSRSRDRHHRRHRSGDHRRRDGHRRRHSSRGGHRHQRQSSSRHQRRSRSTEKRSRNSDKRRRSHSPRPNSSSSFKNAPAPATSTTTPSSAASTSSGSGRPPVYKVMGTKYNRGRGTSTGTFKDLVREQYVQNVQMAENAVYGNTPPALMGPSPVNSSAATVSAGTGVKGGGGLGQVLFEQVQMRLQQQNQYLPGQPGCLTQEQKERNQKLILESTGRTREQVEAQYGITIPKMYNEYTNNLVELAERERKKSMLFGKKDKTPKPNTLFNAVPILPGESKSENVKFARLMGCRKGKSKKEDEAEASKEVDGSPEADKIQMESQIRNSNLEREFEASRSNTHFNRGCGLGYATTMYQPR
ncbi:hypothetical protein ACOMHN_020280 [Nucella lapillus]